MRKQLVAVALFASAVASGLAMAPTASAVSVDSCSNPGYAIPYADPWGENDYSYCQNNWRQGWSQPECEGVDYGIPNKALEYECVGQYSPRTQY
jgi:hypothetical protein